MNPLTIHKTDDDVSITINTSSVPKEKIDAVIRLLQFIFIDDSHITPVSDNEQKEIEVYLKSLSDEDREVVFSHTVPL